MVAHFNLKGSIGVPVIVERTGGSLEGIPRLRLTGFSVDDVASNLPFPSRVHLLLLPLNHTHSFVTEVREPKSRIPILRHSCSPSVSSRVLLPSSYSRSCRTTGMGRREGAGVVSSRGVKSRSRSTSALLASARWHTLLCWRWGGRHAMLQAFKACLCVYAHMHGVSRRGRIVLGFSSDLFPSQYLSIEYQVGADR